MKKALLILAFLAGFVFLLFFPAIFGAIGNLWQRELAWSCKINGGQYKFDNLIGYYCDT